MPNRSFTVTHDVEDGFILWLEETNWKYKFVGLAETLDYWASNMPEFFYFSKIGSLPMKLLFWSTREGRRTVERIFISKEQALSIDADAWEYLED